MIKFITAKNDSYIKRFAENKSVCLIIEHFNVHPTKIQDTVSKFLNDFKDSNAYIVTYNTSALDYVPVDNIIYIDENLTAIPFKEKFKEKLIYMFPGEIYGIIDKEI